MGVVVINRVKERNRMNPKSRQPNNKKKEKSVSNNETLNKRLRKNLKQRTFQKKVKGEKQGEPNIQNGKKNVGKNKWFNRRQRKKGIQRTIEKEDGTTVIPHSTGKEEGD